ncbi:right-handed parallel beta-helix repeat-containing protein [Halomontanus rarus]|uniref:right-handed parallel beta-helix repeat-containing protein n=1 Tax=Halomontanus rarus TaxID=3034020 RepID=UPI0023E8F071|nr:right-handed parallel beta-helix repeat-containing protein [Halovivax sp. TS33]
MAREPSELNEDGFSDSGAESRGNGSNNELIDRRSYMKLAGATTTAAAFVGAASAADEYDVITISPGERRVIRVGSDETFENKLIDMSADGAAAMVYAHGTNWTIRNVGFKGALSGDNRALTCSDQGGNTSVVENVYMGDGVVESSVSSDQYAPALGIWVNPDHSGHLEFKNVYVEGALDNAFYCSAPGYNGKGGTIHIDGCYAKNNAISCYRLGSTNSKVTNSVAVGGPNTHRGVWAWDPGAVELENVHLAMNGDGQAIVAGANGNSTTVNCKSVQYDSSSGYNERYGSTINFDGNCGTSPEDFVPDGCPTTPEMAASGSRDSGSGPAPEPEPSYDYTMRFEGDGAYFFRTRGGEVEGTDGEDRIENTISGGPVEIGYDTYFDNIGVTDGVEARIVVNGTEYEPTWSKFDGPDAEDWLELDVWDAEDEEDEEEGQLENVLVVDGDDSDTTRYEFVASGDVEKSNAEGASIDDEDVIDGGQVHGVVANWKDAFRFDGELEELSVDGPGAVLVNGEEIDPDEVGQQLPHTLEVIGQGTPSSFEITVDGTIEYDGDDADDDVTVVSGTTVESSVSDDTQVFRFSGALTDITFTDGEAVVTLDGEEVDLSEYGDPELLPHAIVIDGLEAEGPTTYSFTVDGKVLKSEYMDASIDDGDIVEGEAVRGGVGNWLDAFWFDGDITDFKLVGDAKVHVEYNVRDQ